jgi:hypothetical protein
VMKCGLVRISTNCWILLKPWFCDGQKNHLILV